MVSEHGADGDRVSRREETGAWISKSSGAGGEFIEHGA